MPIRIFLIISRFAELGDSVAEGIEAFRTASGYVLKIARFRRSGDLRRGPQPVRMRALRALRVRPKRPTGAPFYCGEFLPALNALAMHYAAPVIVLALLLSPPAVCSTEGLPCGLALGTSPRIVEALRALADYRAKYVAPPLPNASVRRVELLRRLEALPTGREALLGKAPQVVKRDVVVRGHSDGGRYFFTEDQYGDRYLETSTRPDLEPFFNVHRGVPGMKGVRLLRDTLGIPLVGLSAEDLALLEPLPQRDPLRSYLGACLVKMFTAEGDKGLPGYEPRAPALGMYTPGDNYFRRTDGTYYVYDLAQGSQRLRADLTELEWDFFWLVKALSKRQLVHALRAIATVEEPERRSASIDFYLDSIFLFPAIGLRAVHESYEELQREMAVYRATIAAKLTRYERLKRALGIAEPPTDPSTRWRSGWRDFAASMEFPLFVHKVLETARGESALAGVDPMVLGEFEAKFLPRLRAYHQSFDGIERDLQPVLDETVYRCFVKENLAEIRRYRIP